ncbi:TIR domain-containing protein [Piscinibacter sakaiensis]|uniref:TIR domain-containing protein n=1 Tax=Piscinibacter sakaiensis TaxID=1547922 RepID=UPI003AAFE318
MNSNTEIELLDARRRLLAYAESYDAAPETNLLNAIWEKAKELGKSASGSWLGYHANVYYADFRPPPAGVHFDVDNGTAGTYFAGPDPAWVEHTGQEVFDLLIDEEGKAALAAADRRAEEGLALLTSVRTDVSSLLTVYLKTHDDKFARRISEEIETAKVLDAADITNEMSPKRQVITRDMRAVQQGTWAPPHIKVQARVTAAHQPAAHCHELAEKLEKLAAHFARVARLDVRSARLGTNVFIGHGRSAVWRDLKDFIQDRLRLPWDEFNRIPVAGITNIARLSEMLDSAACAFVIMTAEDELADGTAQARMNVIHEVGLFQGRLGFTKAIVLLEDGCQEFSNIQGLGQIRFPKGAISAKFEEIRQVLEREGVIEGLKNAL